MVDLSEVRILGFGSPGAGFPGECLGNGEPGFSVEVGHHHWTETYWL